MFSASNRSPLIFAAGYNGRAKARQRNRPLTATGCIDSSCDSAGGCSEGNNILGTWTFLAFAHLKFYFLTFIERCMATVTLDFRMMNEKIFSPILRCNEAKTFAIIEPLDCTFDLI